MKKNHYLAIALLLVTCVVAGCKAHSAEKPPTPGKVKAVGFMAFLGVVSLVGVIVSHVIVLFDFIEEKHA